MSTLRVGAVPISRSPLPLVAALLGLAAVGWLVTGDRMSGMDAGPGTDPGALGFFLTAWVVMMAAMMFPSTAPMVIVYDRIQSRRRELGKPAAVAGTALFVGGYLLTWTAVGLLGWALFEAAQGVSVDVLSWDRGGPYLAGGLIVLAAVYELTPLKQACLRKCRSPMSFLLGGWRDGSVGALRLGVEHGAWCVGCCWALMVALFALGVMSIAWMAFIAALIAAEKLLPWGRSAPLSITVLLAVLGVSVAIAPERVPGLAMPDSAHMTMDGGSMQGMEGGSMQEMNPGGMDGGSMRQEMKQGGMEPGAMEQDRMGGTRESMPSMGRDPEQP